MTVLLPNTGATGDPRMARQVNDRLALDLLLSHGELSRTDLREMTGLAQPTIIDLVKRLERDGRIRKTGHSAAVRPGPSPQLYALVPGQARIAAVRIRDGHIAAAIVDICGGSWLGESEADFAEPDLPVRVAQVIDAAQSAAGLDRARIDHVVIAVPGIVDRSTGDLGFSWDLRTWRGALLEPLGARLGTSVELINGVEASTLAEGDAMAARTPRGSTPTDYAMLWIGTGVGLRMISDGRPFRGSSGAAGQVGYLPIPGAPVVPVEPKAGGFAGDFQALVGAQALTILAREHGLAARSPEEILIAADASDATVADTEFLRAVADRVALGLAAVAALVDPGVVVLQGETGIAGGASLARAVEERLSAISPVNTVVLPPSLVRGTDSDLLGAIAVAQRRVRDRVWGGAPDKFSTS